MSSGRVRQVRELLGWTQAELAAQSGLSQGAISQIESGRVALTAEAAKAISSATSFNSNWLTRPDYQPLPEGTLQFRKMASASQRSTHRATRTLEVLAELTRELQEGLRLPSPRLIPSQLPDTTSDIEDIAQEYRRQMSLSPAGPVPNLMRAAERAGVLFVGLPYELTGHDGVSVWADTADRPIIGYRIESAGDRQRFTVAHELGHLAMHTLRQPTPKEAEAQAHRFAGALLMPEPEARQALAEPLTLTVLARLKSEWGISIAALIKRAAGLDLISREKENSLNKQLSARRWKKVEPVHVPRETPRLFADIVDCRFGGDTRTLASHFGLAPIVVSQVLGASASDRHEGQVVSLPTRGHRSA